MSLPVFDRSPLANANPRGRVDVLASNLLAHAVKRDPVVAQAFESVKPVVDFFLLWALGPEKEFKRALKGLPGGKSQRPRGYLPKAKARKLRKPAKVEVVDAEVVE